MRGLRRITWIKENFGKVYSIWINFAKVFLLLVDADGVEERQERFVLLFGCGVVMVGNDYFTAYYFGLVRIANYFDKLRSCGVKLFGVDGECWLDVWFWKCEEAHDD